MSIKKLLKKFIIIKQKLNNNYLQQQNTRWSKAILWFHEKGKSERLNIKYFSIKFKLSVSIVISRKFKAILL